MALLAELQSILNCIPKKTEIEWVQSGRQLEKGIVILLKARRMQIW